MARSPQTLGEEIRIADHLAIGTISQSIPREVVEEALKRHEVGSQRHRALPAEMVVYYVIALGLYMGANYREVLRVLLEARAGRPFAEPPRIPVPAAITKARARLGEEVFQDLCDCCVKPRAKPAENALGWYRSYRLVSLDGTTLDTVDTTANEEAFGKAANAKGSCGFPKMRVVSLVENASHILFAPQQGSYSTGETTLAQEVVKSLQPDMLCLADRGFCNYGLWKAASAQGAQLLWRSPAKRNLPEKRRLADGSYLADFTPTGGDGKPITVRVIEFEVHESGHEPVFYRLLTTLLDPEKAPAEELADVYLQRWEVETVFDELKTHLRGARSLLRSKHPMLVRQEFYALIMAHFVVRSVMYEASLQDDGDEPFRLSYTHAIHVIRRKLPQTSGFSPLGATDAAQPDPEGDS